VSAGTRAATLAAIRRNRPAGDHPLPQVPVFAPLVADDHVAAFTEALKRMGGRVVEAGPAGDPLGHVRERLDAAKVVASAVPEHAGNRDLSAVTRPQAVDDVDVAIVRARFGIAETGSVLFTEAELVVNAVAYLAQHLVVLLDPADIVVNVQAAYKRPDFAGAAYAVLHTGPSATADIEGVLIHGAQGVRSLTVVLLPRGDVRAA
jgi:L-lactate dehydrogenase complex protein LldG